MTQKQFLHYFSFPAQPISQPPDVTNNAKSTRQADRVGPYAASHISSVRMTNTGSVTGLSDDGEYATISFDYGEGYSRNVSCTLN